MLGFLLFGRFSRVGNAVELLALFEAVSLGADLGLDVQIDRLLDVLLELGDFLESKPCSMREYLE